MSNMNDEYNVAEYNDEELYQLLDLSHPTDRELEAKIVMMMTKYASNENMYNFFVDVYQHFFDVVNEDEEEEEDDTTDAVQDGFGIQDKANEGKSPNVEGRSQEPFTQQVQGQVLDQQQVQEQDQAQTQAQAQLPVQPPPKFSNKTFTTTNTIAYPQGTVNPLLKKTIRRVISIDSQFRDKTLYPYSTNFTFNLSEPLRDVVSMKLYSVQIPYTWYTINNYFGSNFFYIKGVSTGVDNDHHSYKISIPSGNYASSDFVTAINKSITTMAADHPEVNFGTTSVQLSTMTTKMTTTIDIKHVYDERSFQLEWQQLPQSDTSVTSIPQLLGFQQSNYLSCTLRSAVILSTLPSTYQIPLILPSIDIYNVQDTNNCLLSMTPSATLLPGTVYSTAEILNLYQTTSTAFDAMTFHITDLDPKASSNGQQVYELTMNLSPKLFPSAQYIVHFKEDVTNPLFVGPYSCFNFSNSWMTLSTVVSESSSKTTSYAVDTGTTINLTCMNSLYECSGNNFTMDVSGTTYDTYQEYFSGIQRGMNDLSNNTYGMVKLNLQQDVITHLVSIHANIQNIMNQDNDFRVDLSGCILHEICKQPTSLSNNLSSNSNYELTFAVHQRNQQQIHDLFHWTTKWPCSTDRHYHSYSHLSKHCQYP